MDAMDDDTSYFVADGIKHTQATYMIVDGIYSRKNKLYGNYFFSLKEDVHQDDLEFQDEFLDDSRGVGVYWDSPYFIGAGSSFSNGDIDEEIWLKYGAIVGVDSPAAESYNQF